MNLRIFGGELKGRMIKTLAFQQVRPTTGVIRQAVFNICHHEVNECFFLDLFAGSGAMGMEALSQGAQYAVFVEKHKPQARLIEKNLLSLGLEKKARVFHQDVFKALENLSPFSFDLVYIDPPYHEMSEKNIMRIFYSLDELHLLKKGARLFLEEPFTTKKSLLALNELLFIVSKSRKFGRSLLHEVNYLR